MSTKTKKICPRVSLQVSDKDHEPVICTTSDINRSKAFEAKTQLNCYQNTSDLTNPRLASQRMLVMDCDGVQSVGKSWETKIYGSNYMIGILDRNTNEMVIRPASLINLKPYVKSYELDEVESSAKQLSYGEKHKKLAMKFGGNKIQKAIRGKDRVHNMESNTLDEAMEEAVVSVDAANLTQKSESPQNDILPPMNLQATELSDVFTITDLISESEMSALLPFTQILKECTQFHVNAWIEQEKYPQYMLSRLPIVMDDEHLAHLYLSQLLYISYLVTLLKTPRNQLRKKKTLFPNTPSVVIDTIYKKFTSQGQVDGKIRTSISDKQRNQLICHILALTLIVDNFCVPFTVLSKDLEVKVRVISDTYRSMGCSITKLKGQSNDPKAVLKIPVKLPSMVLRKGGKKRD